MSSHKERVARRFGDSAGLYAASPRFSSAADLQILLALLAPASDMRVLDVATGAGFTAATVAPYVRAVVAIDLAPAMLAQTRALARARGLQNVTTLIMDVEQLAFRDASFDAATCRIAPHHFSDVKRALQEVARVLRTGGVFVVEDTCAPGDPEEAQFLNDLDRLRDPTHVRAYTEDEWREMLSLAGFVVVRVEMFPDTLQVEEWLARSGLDKPGRQAVYSMLANAPPEMRKRFDLRFAGGLPISYRDVKAIFRAERL